MTAETDGHKVSSTVEICAICAWRAGCQKKYSMSGRDMRCPDFVKDVSIKDQNEGREVK